MRKTLCICFALALAALGSAQRFRGAVLAPTSAEQLVVDISDLAAAGGNLGRYQLHLPDDAESRRPQNIVNYCRERAREIRDVLLPVCRLRNFKLVIDFHEGPGDFFGGYPERGTSGYLRSNAHERTLRTAWLAMWEELKSSSDLNFIYGLDLYNEPLILANERRDDNEYDRLHARHVRSMQTIINDLRGKNCRLPIIVESVNVNPQRITMMPKLNDRLDKVIYSVHMYDSNAFTHGRLDPNSGNTRLYTYPGTVGSGKRAVLWDREKLEDFLAVVRQWQRKNKVRIYIGEFSAKLNAGSSAPDFIEGDGSGEEWLADVIQIFERYNWDWTYHAWREAAVWNPELLPRRLDLLKAAWGKNANP